MDSLTYTFVIPQPMMSLGQLVDGAFDDHNGGKPNSNGFGLLAIEEAAASDCKDSPLRRFSGARSNGGTLPAAFATSASQQNGIGFLEVGHGFRCLYGLENKLPAKTRRAYSPK